MDFLPNSITRSPQRSSCSHTATTQRLGLTKANRIGAVQLADPTMSGSFEFAPSVMQTKRTLEQGSVFTAGRGGGYATTTAGSVGVNY